MRCLIVDDEAPARSVLAKLLARHPDVEVVGEAADVQSALELTKSEQPEVVFLDIKLRGESGFDYVALAPDPPPHIIFVTAYDQYAVRGFECNALDYLLKPVEDNRLAESLSRVHSRRPTPPEPKEDDLVFLKGPSTGRFAPWRTISHIESDGNYSRIILDGGLELQVLRTLKEWLTMTPEGLFLQIHRTAIVRRTAIAEVRSIAEGRREVVLASGAVLPVGRAYRDGLLALM
jgi:two-component system LytT family response regulator